MELRETKRFSSRKREVNDAFSLHQAFAEKVAEKAVLILGVIVIVVLLMLLLRSAGLFDANKLRTFVQNAGPYGPIAAIAIFVFGGLTLSMPATPAIVIAGVLFGPWLGVLYAIISILLAASIAFFISRYFRQYIISVLGTHAAVLVKFQEHYVAYAIFITRLVPLFHFEVISYAAGLTSVSYLAFIIATFLGMIPITFVLTRTGTFILETSTLISVLSAVGMILALFIIPLAIDHYNPWGWKQKLLKEK